MYCSTCGFENPAGNNYCLNDGTKLKPHNARYSIDFSASTFCSDCGKNVSVKDNYCDSCGSALLNYQKAGLMKPAAVKGEQAVSFPRSIKNHFKTALISAIAGLLLVFLINWAVLAINEATYKSFLKEAYGGSFNIENMTDYFESTTDSNLPEPGKLVGVTDMVMASHLISPTLSTSVGEFMEDEFKREYKLSLGLVINLLIPAIALFIAGIFFRKKTKEASIYSVFYGSLSIAPLYGVILSIVSFFSGFSYEVKIEELSLDLSTSYFFLAAFLKGFGIAFLFSLIGMLFSITFKKATGHLSDMLSIGEALHQGIATFFRSFLIFAVIMMIAVYNGLKRLEIFAAESLGSSPLGLLLEKSFGFILAAGAQLGVYAWNLASFGALAFTGKEDKDEFSLAYSILSGLKPTGDYSGSDMFEMQMFLDSINFGLYTKLAVLILAALFVWSGYRLAVKGNASIKSLAIYSLVYSVMFGLLTYLAGFHFSSESLATEDSYHYEITFGVSAMATFVKSLIMSFILAYAGTLIVKWRR